MFDVDVVMDRNQLIMITVIAYWYLRRRAEARIERIRDNNSILTGHTYTQELLRGSSTQCQELMRLSRDAYVLLCNHFKENNWLQSSNHISAEEKMAMFLTIIGHNERFRMVKRRFQHSTRTIHLCFHEVLNGMMEFAREVVRPTSFDGTLSMSERVRKLKEIFPGAIGALDGTLIHAVVPLNQQARYRGRGRGDCYQNVLAMCDFNMIFTYVWAGWEGIAHDARVLREVAFDPNSRFPFPPPNKYYLCDAAYPNTRGFLTPYRNTRYWLADFRRRRPVTKQEKFNHAHAQLRNVIERAYGVMKARFPILKQMAPYPYSKQIEVVVACFAIHNFIRRCNIQDQLFMEYDENAMFTAEEEHGGGIEEDIVEVQWGSSQDNGYMANLRDQIATRLFSNA
ncbi:hypothetical protein OSB04_023465 [Centaurea solstitialis]|uniref:DDE Tnp4 domain-containing protein n=1 Tax=Centaurea solstitialis TaxID=347529 RepID=A0AA38T3V8_9ASTR|nr:hypothetical protein OSB04_023465 [Centaurea solstitialis]